MPAFNVQGNAVLGVLAFLGTGLLVALGAAVLALLLWKGRRKPALQVAGGLAVIVGLYAAVLLLSAVSSRERVLSRGEEKYFCEVDCHLAYSVEEVRRATVLGPTERPTRAAGTFYLVALKTRFDPDTISTRRPRDMTLTPNPRRVVVVDRRGRSFQPSRDGEEALLQGREDSIPLTRPLLPGESYVTRLVFDLPADVEQPRLLVTEEDWPTRLVIGHENSFGHKKTVFAL